MPEQTYNDKSNDQKAPKNNFTLTEVITTAIKMPVIKVNRDTFLREQFKDVSKEKMEKIIDVGPVKAGAGRHILKKWQIILLIQELPFLQQLHLLPDCPAVRQ